MTGDGRHRFVRVEFRRFKAFEKFSLDLRHFNILVGPNNAGKSTILTAFRILAAAFRKANSKKTESIRGPEGRTFGYLIDLRAISVAEENIFYNYDDSEAASVTFKLSNKNELTLYFPEYGACYLIADARGGQSQTPTSFRRQFNCPIGFVPILGPVEHNERLYDKEAARLALFNYRAARNFRNIWYHYPEKFEEFRAILAQTWPGMDVERPKINLSHDKPTLDMFCPEERIRREIFWSGFGFAEEKKDYVMAQYIAERWRFERQSSRGLSDATINEAALKEFNAGWQQLPVRLKAVPGKEAVSAINQHLQKLYGVSVTPTSIIDAMKRDEITSEMEKIVQSLSEFAKSKLE